MEENVRRGGGRGNKTENDEVKVKNKKVERVDGGN